MSEKKVQPAKVEAVNAIKEQLGEINDFFFTDYRGLTVEQITELRTRLRESDGEIHVVKNNLAKIAFRDMEKGDDVSDLLVGPTAVAYTRSESGPVAKTLVEFEKDSSLELKGGLVEGSLYDQAQVVAYSKLPTKLELIQMLMGTMQAPVRNAMYAMRGVTEKLVRTLDAVREQKGQG